MKQDKVAVHEAMRADSEVRSELKKGDVVRVELEVSGGPDGAWSSIADIQGRHLGYVPTAALERDAAPRARWHVVEPSGSRPRAPARGQARRPAGGRGPEQGTEELEPQRSRSAPRGTRASSEVRVQFFAVRWCGWCNKTRVLLRSLGVSVDEYDIEAQPERKAELVARSGQTGVPFLDIEGITMVGYSEAAIRRAVEERRAAE